MPTTYPERDGRQLYLPMWGVEMGAVETPDGATHLPDGAGDFSFPHTFVPDTTVILRNMGVGYIVEVEQPNSANNPLEDDPLLALPLIGRDRTRTDAFGVVDLGLDVFTINLDGVPGVAPVWDIHPSFDETEYAPGDPVTMDIGQVTGPNPVTVQYFLTLEGDDISADLVGTGATRAYAAAGEGVLMFWALATDTITGLQALSRVQVATVAALVATPLNSPLIFDLWAPSPLLPLASSLTYDLYAPAATDTFSSAFGPSFS